MRGLKCDCNAHDAEPDFFSFDIARGEEYGFKAVQEREGVLVAKGGLFVELYEGVAEMMTTDPRLEPIRDFEFTPRTLR